MEVVFQNVKNFYFAFLWYLEKVNCLVSDDHKHVCKDYFVNEKMVF